MLIFVHCSDVVVYTVDQEGHVGLYKVISQQFMKIYILILILK